MCCKRLNWMLGLKRKSSWIAKYLRFCLIIFRSPLGICFQGNSWFLTQNSAENSSMLTKRISMESKAALRDNLKIVEDKDNQRLPILQKAHPTESNLFKKLKSSLSKANAMKTSLWSNKLHLSMRYSRLKTLGKHKNSWWIEASLPARKHKERIGLGKVVRDWVSTLI